MIEFLRGIALALLAAVLIGLGSPEPAIGQSGPTAPGPAATQAAQPTMTNAEIRQWYNDQVATIPSLDEKWQAEGLGAEERAHRAYEIRHAARLQARNLMANKQEVADLQARDQEKYGNPDGPTFEQLVQQGRDRGLQGDAVYEAIIGSSNRTNQEYNQRFNVKPPGQ